MINIQAYRIGSGFWIESVYGKEYCSRTVVYLQEQREINDYWIVSASRIVTVFGIYYSYSIVNVLGIFVEKG